jgi:hypothetical protein
LTVRALHTSLPLQFGGLGGIGGIDWLVGRHEVVCPNLSRSAAVWHHPDGDRQSPRVLGFGQGDPQYSAHREIQVVIFTLGCRNSKTYAVKI